MSGTPPGEMLYTAPVTYDQGWDLAKVYEPNRDDWDVKAYHWGSLTSKSSLSAFWILLAPFAMANVAGWMSEAPNVWSRIWMRVAGLSLTGIFFAQAANMALDIPLSTGVSEPAVLAIFSAACAVLVVGLGLLSTQSTFKPLTLAERLRFLFAPSIGSMNPPMSEPDWADPAREVALVGLHMWSVHSIVHRLRRIHLTFGMAVLAVIAARAVGTTAIEASGIVLAGVMMVVIAFTSSPGASRWPTLGLTAIGPVAGLGLLVWAIANLASGDLVAHVVNTSDDLTFEIALILGIAAGLGLLGELIMSRFRSGWVPMGLLAVAALIGGTLGLTGAMLVETYLTESSNTSETFDAGSAFVTLAMLGLVVVMLSTFVIAMFIPRRESDGSKTRRGVLRARYVLASAGVYAGLIGIAAAVLSCGGGPGCSQANIVLPSWMVEDPANLTVLLGLPFDPASLLGWAKILMVAVPAFLIVRSIVGGLLNGQDSRRQVGILWDLGSFWPRWFHPLGPPAYGPYAVNRLQTVLAAEKPDVLAAHSQGSLVAAVALCLTNEDQAPGMFLTYGSQIGDLYPMLFPSVGFDPLVASATSQVDGRWINLWRRTDPIGGQPVEALGDRNWEVRTGAGHSLYELTPEFCAARKAGPGVDLTRPPESEMADCWPV
ncbi:MAG: hypothetical protein WAL25_12935 [Acidimicrobiia bacterium]